MSNTIREDNKELLTIADTTEDFDAVALVNSIRQSQGLAPLTEEEEKE